MNLELSEELIALRDTVRAFVSERASVSTFVRPMLDDDTGTTDVVWRGLADLGVTGLLVPLEHDGAGMTMVEAGVVAEELGAGLYPGPWLSSAVAAARALTRFEVPLDVAAPLLTGIADGSTIATVGPLHGPRPAVVNDGLRGAIKGVWDVASADVLLVVADDRNGTGLFAIQPTADGITSTLQAGIDQTRKRFDVTLDDVTAQRLGSVSHENLEALVDDVTIAWAADALGAARALLNLVIEYAKVRRQFSQPIGAFQAVQHLCVGMYETVELARSGVIHALWAADTGDRPERHAAAMRTKAFAGRLAAVGDTAIQLFGGIGYTWEHDAHLYLKRLLSWNAFLDGSDRYLVQLGAEFAAAVLG
ncbi:acyl-CoA dehydrogenase family protein [Mycobacterium paraterrae]|uniref:Acyl-CoA/acyl-ACP dehydrogenase n=1 Tax=Mycobacterium paraterrae TaxID=577492 RepID=A0ABY3VNX4_9MYCO|nr:acyl-CoA dehydrogenase family protein [Mycobacterium paraterrae]UMB71111.1 acyl-CoA/acyl-ACP dehydrogenase [Mycobacterium paraterrae]